MKIGIITMHHVVNFGSALQSYALQHTLHSMGVDSEIIDYRLKKNTKGGTWLLQAKKQIFIFVKNIVTGFSRYRAEKKFNCFRMQHLKLSAKTYSSDNINKEKFCYDIYMTGSDQVWNPKHIDNDVNYFLAFAPDECPKISYASSFATKSLAPNYVQLYSKYLKRYKHISVREKSGVDIVSKMVGEHAIVDCDPVLLVKSKDWEELSAKSSFKVDYKYILVYALYYMFDPYPQLNRIIEHARKTLGYRVIYLNARTREALMSDSSIYKAGGPNEFLYLIKNAELIITTSFHGTAFSAIFDKPVMGIVKGDESDDRISSLLICLNANESIVKYDSCIDSWSKEKILSLRCNQDCLRGISDASKDNLLNSIRIIADDENRRK